MTPFNHIRENIFKLSQAEMSVELGVSQPTISRLENDKVVLSADIMHRVRRLAAEKRVRWNDSLFFEVPADKPRR